MKLPLALLDTRPRPVAPGFWVGGRDARQVPPDGGWRVIVNCTPERYEEPEGVRVIQCAIEDGERWSADELTRTFLEFSAAWSEAPGPTLIHCSAGVSRSVTMAIYLLTRLGVFDTAPQALAACRYSALPFFGPRRQTHRSVLAALAAHRASPR